MIASRETTVDAKVFARFGDVGESHSIAVGSFLVRRTLAIERLSDRRLLAVDLHNANQPLDVNDDLRVTALDALRVIEWLRKQSLGSITSGGATPSYVDVNSDGRVSAVDALQVINRLHSDSPISVLRLANDTAPHGQTNRDAITRDATIQGRVAVPWHLDASEVSLRGISNTGDQESINLASYLDQDYFEVPSSRIEQLLRTSNGNPTDRFRVELVAHRGNAFADNAVALANLTFLFDIQPPEILLPESIDVSAQSTTLAILEPSNVSAESLSTLAIRQPIVGHPDTGPLRTFQTHTRSERVLVDLALEQFEFPDEFAPLNLQIEGVLEDLAGNRTTLPVRRSIERRSGLAPPLVAVEVSQLTPDVGIAFDDLRPSVRAGQLISVFLPTKLIKRPFRFTVVDDVDGGTVTLRQQSIYPQSYDERLGILTLRVPEDTVSGEVTNWLGQVVMDLDVIPGNRRLPEVRNERWDIDQHGSPSGGIDVDNGQFHYRTFGSDDSSDDAIGTPVDRQQVATWPLIRDGFETTFGFATAQLAGPHGVSGAIEIVEAHLDVHRIDALALTNNGSAFWVAADQEVRRVDHLTGQATTIVQLTDVAASPAFYGRALDIHVVPLAAFGGRVERTEASPIDSATPVVAVRLSQPIEGSHWLLLDAEDGTPLGRVADVVDLSDADYDAVTVYNPLRGSWFQIWRNGSRWREVSLSDGGVVSEGIPADSIPDELTRGVAPHFSNDLVGGVFWDREAGMIRMLLRSKISPNAPPSMLDFDAGQRQFVISDNTFESFDLLPQTQMRRLLVEGDWIYGHNDSSDSDYYERVIRRERAVRTSDPQDPSEPALMTEIRGVARHGRPTDPMIASANPGQFIEVVGENLSTDTMLVFDIDEQVRHYGYWLPPNTGIEEVRLTEVSEDHTRAKVRVPSGATSAVVPIAGQSTGLALQIVPSIEPDPMIRGDESVESRMLHSYSLIGLGTKQYSVLIDDELVLGCVLPLQETCKPFSQPRHWPLIKRKLEVITAGGQHRIEVPAAEVAERQWTIESFDGVAQLGRDYEYDGLPPSEVLALSTLYIQVRPLDGNPTETLPAQLMFLLRGDDASTGGVRFHRLTGTRTEDNRYRVALPIDFRGGTLAIEEPVGSPTSSPEERIRIEVAPTVIGASGDSARPGSTILLAGVHLADAAFTIDDIAITAEAAPPIKEPGLDAIALTVPENATAGLLRIRKGPVTATLDRLRPWWRESAMPTANVGTATYDSLPSANFHQEFEYDVECRPNGPLSCQGVSVLPTRYQGRRLAANGLSTLYHTIGGLTADDRIILRPDVFSQLGPVFLFGDRSGRSLNLLPLVPTIDGIHTRSAESAIDDDRNEAWLDFDIDEYRSDDGVEILWGDDRWSASYSGRQFLSLPGSPLIERAFRYGDSPDSLIQQWKTQRPGRDPSLLPGVWLGPDNLAELPPGPIRVSNGWGISAWNPSEPEEVEELVSELVASSGTAADPDLPSVNVGQRLDVPASLRERKDAVVFARRSDLDSDLSSERANWTAATEDGPNHSEMGFRVPARSVTGMMRWGLLSKERFVQVVPTISVYSFGNPPNLHLYATGVDYGDQVQIGDFSVPLSDDEVDKGLFILSMNDPRLSGLTGNDLAGGFSVIGAGGRSEVVFFPAVTGIMVNGIPAAQNRGPIRVSPGDELTLLGSGLPLETRGLLVYVVSQTHSLALTKTISVAEDGKSVTIRLSESIKPGDLWQLQLDARSPQHGSYVDVTWSLQERRLLFVPDA